MRKIRLTIFLLLMLISPYAMAQNNLVVYLNDGSSATFPLQENPEITFAGENFKVISSTATIELPRSDVKDFRFEKGEDTAIEQLAKDNTSITSEGDNIIIAGLADNSVVKVFNTSGQTVVTTRATGSNCSISLSRLTNGIYIINYNNKSIKILKK